MTTSEPYLHEYADPGGLIDPTAIPDTLLAMMRYVSEEYLPEITAHVEQANEWLGARPDLETGTNGLDDPAFRSLDKGPAGSATFSRRGIDLTTSVMPYRFWLMQRLHDDLAAASDHDQARTREVFAAAGLELMLDLRTLRRVERDGHLEVWAPPV